jgi:hypothetical protein
MRILAVIPHYYGPSSNPSADGRRHGSVTADPSARAEALASCIAALHQQFHPTQSVIDIARRITIPANAPLTATVDVVVGTTRDAHVLTSAAIDRRSFEHLATGADPMFLGIACRAVLRERVGLYDHYCYLEDDLTIRDPWLFAKLAWFNKQAGDERLLQPNRYELARSGIVRKAYVDGDLADRVIARFVDVNDDPEVRCPYLDREIRFIRAKNPHSGCYFLNSRQMATLAARADFLDKDASFVGPLESAATLGILRAFKVYKPAPENAAFLEIEHFGTGFVGLIRMPLEGELERR